MAKRIVALDFDNTLCNTAGLRKLLAATLPRLGVRKLRPEAYDETYAAAVAGNPAGYTITVHAKLIAATIGRDTDEPFVRRIVDQFRLTLGSGMKRLLAEDAGPFIQAVKAFAEVRILTYGDLDWQWTKLKASGILNYFEREQLVITGDPLGKEAEVLKMLEEERAKVLYINDRFEENERIMASDFIPEFMIGQQFMILEMQRGWEKEPSHDSNRDLVHDLGPETVARVKAFMGAE